MSNVAQNSQKNDHQRKIFDWIVFSLGVASLTFAVGATVVTKTDILGMNDTATAQDEVTAG